MFCIPSHGCLIISGSFQFSASLYFSFSRGIFNQEQQTWVILLIFSYRILYLHIRKILFLTHQLLHISWKQLRVEQLYLCSVGYMVHSFYILLYSSHLFVLHLINSKFTWFIIMLRLTSKGLFKTYFIEISKMLIALFFFIRITWLSCVIQCLNTLLYLVLYSVSQSLRMTDLLSINPFGNIS